MKARKPSTEGRQPPTSTSRKPAPSRAANLAAPALGKVEVAPGFEVSAKLGSVRLPPVFATFQQADPGGYGMRLDGDCLEPEVFAGDTAICSPKAPLVPGHYVVLWPRGEGRPLMKRLISACPWRPGECEAPGSNVMGLVECEMLKPAKRFFIPYDQLKAIHAIVGIMRGKEVIHVASKPAGKDFDPGRMLLESIAGDAP